MNIRTEPLLLLLLAADLAIGLAACQSAPPPASPALPLPIAWQARVTDEISRPVISDGLILIVDARNRLIALDAATGAERWEASLNRASRSDDPLGVDAGRIFAAVSGDASKVVALDAATGSILWEAASGKQVNRDEHPIARDGTVYYEAADAAGASSVLRAADAATGQTRWEAPVDSYIRTAPILGDSLVYVGTYRFDGNTKSARRVIAFDAASGQERWSYSSDLDLGDRFALDGSRLYFGVDGGVVIARDATTGEAAWAARVGGSISNSPVVADGVVYVGTTDGALTALNAADGAVRWTANVKSSILSDVAVHGGQVYFGTNDGTAYAVNAGTGAIAWQVQAPERRSLGVPPYVPAMATTPVVVGDLLLYFDTNALYALRLK